MTPKITVTFVVSLTLFMTPKGHRFIRSRRDLIYVLIGNGDLCGRFDLVYDPKGHGSLEVAVTFFITPMVRVTLLVRLT